MQTSNFVLIQHSGIYIIAKKTLHSCRVEFIFLSTLTFKNIQNGIHSVTLLDWAVGSYPLLVVGLLEVVVVNHVYGE